MALHVVYVDSRGPRRFLPERGNGTTRRLRAARKLMDYDGACKVAAKWGKIHGYQENEMMIRPYAQLASAEPLPPADLDLKRLLRLVRNGHVHRLSFMQNDPEDGDGMKRSTVNVSVTDVGDDEGLTLQTCGRDHEEAATLMVAEIKKRAEVLMPTAQRRWTKLVALKTPE